MAALPLSLPSITRAWWSKTEAFTRIRNFNLAPDLSTHRYRADIPHYPPQLGIASAKSTCNQAIRGELQENSPVRGFLILIKNARRVWGSLRYFDIHNLSMVQKLQGMIHILKLSTIFALTGFANKILTAFVGSYKAHHDVAAGTRRLSRGPAAV